MVDTLSKRERTARMQRIKGRDTKPELIVRRLVHAMGYRYRLHCKDLPGRPDLVFRSRRKVIFVHGCFWHRHPDPDCKLARFPKSNLEFWITKLEGNRQRDITIQRKLTELGWEYLEVWECQIKDTVLLSNKIEEFLEVTNNEIN